MIVLLFTVCTLVGCTKGKEVDSEPIIYIVFDELVESEVKSRSDNSLLAGMVPYKDYVIGILYGIAYDEEGQAVDFYQFFFAREVEGGYILDTTSGKQASTDAVFHLKSEQGGFTVQFAMGQTELQDDVQFLDSIAVNDGKKVDIGVSQIALY